jgi:hypothetical protein
MAEFSATDAALEGFRLTREKPRAVLVWAGLMLLSTVVFYGLMLAFGGEALNAVMSGGSAGGDPEATMAALGRVAPLYALLLPLGIIFYAVLYGAVYRAVLRPGEGGIGYLKFGGDELRLAATLAFLGLLLGGAIIGIAVVLGLIVGGLAAAGGAAALGAVLIPLIGLGLGVFFGVRMSLAMPATFAERRIVVFGSWRLTKGRFWPLLGTYLMSIILSLVVYLLAMMIYFAVAALLGGGIASAGSVFSPDFSNLGALLTTAMLIYLPIASLVGAVTTAITGAPPAAVYRDITGYGGATAEVFS